MAQLHQLQKHYCASKHQPPQTSIIELATTTTTTLAIQPGSSHGNAGQTGSQPSSVAPNGQNHNLQQANTSSSTNSALQTTASRVSRPASPSSPTSTSTEPTVRITRTKIRRCWEIVQTIAAWVAIAFTIGSFVRDYLDITKDCSPSPQESWELQNAFWLSCEYDRRADLQSDACDLAPSMPASPPPGILKRALHERSVLHDFELENYTLYGLWALLVLATIAVSITIDKLTDQSREEQSDTCSGGKHSSKSAGEQQHEVETHPSHPPPDQPCQEDDGTSPASRGKNVVSIVALALMGAPVIYWIYHLVAYERPLPDAYTISPETCLGSTLVFVFVLSFGTTATSQEVLATGAAYCVILAACCAWFH